MVRLPSDRDALGRVMFAPPGVPADRLKFLQDAVAKVVKDPKLLTEAKQTNRYIIYRDPNAAQLAIDRVLNAPTPAQRAEIENIILRKYAAYCANTPRVELPREVFGTSAVH